MRLEHVGVAVRDAESAISLLYRLFGERPYKSELVESEAVRTVFFDAGGVKLELLEATLPESAVARYVERRGEGLHHLAFEVDDIAAAHDRLAEAGFRLLNDAPKRGADEKLIFFIHPKDTAGMLVELCQTAPRRKAHFAQLRGRRLAYYTAGPAEAPPLLMLHAGLGSFELDMHPLAKRLEPHFRTIGLDFAGHGRSADPPEDTVDATQLVQDAIGLLDHLSIDRTHVFGYALGGSVALQLAHRLAGRIDRVAVHAAHVRWEATEAAEMAAALSADRILLSSPARADQLARAHGENRWRHLSDQMNHLVRALPGQHVLDDDLATIEPPVLISHGDSDRFVRLEHALHLWSTLPRARLAVHPGAGHPIQDVDQTHLANMVRGFLMRA